MKRKCIGMMVCFIILLLGQAVIAQNTVEIKSTITPYPLKISYNKTTNLVFPFSINSIDRGSKEVLVQKAKGVENVLQLKAANDSLKETNLTVITADGSLYSFLISFANEPSNLNYNIGSSTYFDSPLIQLDSSKSDQGRIKKITELIANKKPAVSGPRDKHYDVKLKLDGIYIQDAIIYYQIEIDNATNIPYDIEQLRFFIHDQAKAKRTATQEIEISPIYIDGYLHTIAGKSKKVMTYVLPKFTIPDRKFLAIQLMEKNGGRHLNLRIKNKAIIHAIPIN